SRIEEFGFSASSAATTAMTSTPVRPSITKALGEALRPEMLYRSSTRAEEQTIICEDIVDIMAASTAASTRPATNGWKKTWLSSKNTVSLFVSLSGSLAKYAIPISEVATAPTEVRN